MTRRWIALAIIYAALIGAGLAFGDWLSRWAAMDVRPVNEPEIHRMVMMVTAVYILASSMPFIPGAEIGFALIAVFGSRVVPLVYVSMIMALLLAFCVGRFVPPRLLMRFFDYLGLSKARDLVRRTAELPPSARIDLLVERSPHRFVPFLLRHRYIALALALNMPGNTLIGGGGGLGFIAGMSGLFSFGPFLVTTMIAVAPLPLMVLLTGYQP